MVRHDRAAKAAVKHRYPLAMMRLALGMYRGERRIAWRNTVSDGMYTQKAVIAGCSLAMHILGLVALDAVD
eukprot:1544736-Karenia_brevis.AAC.1